MSDRLASSGGGAVEDATEDLLAGKVEQLLKGEQEEDGKEVQNGSLGGGGEKE